MQGLVTRQQAIMQGIAPPHHMPCMQAPLAGMANVVPFNAPEDKSLRTAYHDSAIVAPQAARELIWRIMRCVWGGGGVGSGGEKPRRRLCTLLSRQQPQRAAWKHACLVLGWRNLQPGMHARIAFAHALPSVQARGSAGCGGRAHPLLHAARLHPQPRQLRGGAGFRAG